MHEQAVRCPLVTKKETLGAIGSQCTLTTEPGGNQIFWIRAISQPKGRQTTHDRTEFCQNPADAGRHSLLQW